MSETKISSEVVFSCPIFKVEHAKVRLETGEVQDRWYVLKRDAVGVVAVDEQGRVLLTREYRSAAGEVRWRVPAGGLEDDEEPEAGARRELREETGYDAKVLVPILSKKSGSAWIKQASHFFLARDLYWSPLKTLEVEEIEVIPTPFSEVKRLLDRGEVEGFIAEALARALDQL